MMGGSQLQGLGLHKNWRHQISQKKKMYGGRGGTGGSTESLYKKLLKIPQGVKKNLLDHMCVCILYILLYIYYMNCQMLTSVTHLVQKTRLYSLGS